MILAKGSVSQRPFARVYYTLGAKNITGELTLRDGDVVVRSTWSKGRIVSADSPLAADAPIRIALAKGLVPRSKVTTLGAALKGLSFLDAIETLANAANLNEAKKMLFQKLCLVQAASRQLAFERADFEVSDECNLQPLVEAGLDVRQIIFAGLKNHYSIERFQRELAALGPRALSLAPAAPVDAFGFDPQAQKIVDTLAQRELSLPELIRATESDEGRVMAVVYALVASDCAKVGAERSVSEVEPERKIATQTRATTPRPAANDPSKALRDDARKAEVEALVRGRAEMLKGESNHYELLGVEVSASTGDVQKSYFKLAKLLHPDKVQALDLGDLQAMAQQVFAAVNKAFSVVSHPKLAAEYQVVLAAGGERAFAKKKAEQEKQARKILEGETHFHAGEMSLKRQHFEDARQAFENAVACNALEGDYLANLAWSTWCAATGDKTRMATVSLAQLERAAKLSPNSPLVAFRQGQIYKQIGRLDQAIASFKQTLERDPKHHDAGLELRVLTRRQEV